MRALRFAVVSFLLMPLPALAGDVDFNRDIRPILSERCFQCHGPDAGQRKGDLRLDTKAGLLGKSDGQGVVIAKHPGKSELLKRLTSKDSDLRMPPPKAGKPLTAQQITLIKRWIEQGAEWKGHWAYLKVSKPAPPMVGKSAFVRNDIDKFILARMRSAPGAAGGLAPASQADRRTLIRRLKFDLLGLPPTPKEVSDFLNDKRSDAYERLVDRFLKSPHFGERMAMYWLDVVRYADTNGIHGDNHRDIWLYRDYVIRSFNNNKPFDQFTREQLAGDLMKSPPHNNGGSRTKSPPLAKGGIKGGSQAAIDRKIASGYNRLLMTTREGGAQAKEYRAKYAADRVRNTSIAWLGSTMGCAECHDHKYDPFTAKDFYSFAAFFADIKETAVGKQPPNLKLSTPAQKAELAAIARKLKVLSKQKKGKQPQVKKEINALKRKQQALLKRIPNTLISESMPKPRKVRVLPRGNWLDDSGQVVKPAAPGFLKGIASKDKRLTRLDLANWIASKDNPLTSRVFVNRLWKLYFGRGIVRSVDDFGAQGTWPTHPRLLDWLAADFVDHGWDVKRTIKQIVMSGAYQQSSSPKARRLRAAGSDGTQPVGFDADNKWFARQGRFRLDAELVRDNALYVSGLLVHKIGGKSVKPYQPVGYWSHLNFPRRTWKHDTGDAQYRRGLYTYWCRTFLHPSLLAFDAPSREECAVERPRSNTPLQALVLLNDPTYVEASRALAERILRGGGKTTESRLDFAFSIVLQRKPRKLESQVLTALAAKHLADYRKDEKAANELLNVGLKPAPKDLNAAELAAWTSVSRVLLNLHETITRY